MAFINTGEVFAESYPRAIALNNSVYLVTDVELNINDIGKEIGKIEHQRVPMPKKNGESNDTPVGSLIFEIVDTNTQEAIAVKINSKFYFASQISPIQGETIRNITVITLSIISFLVLITIIMIWIRSRKMNSKL